MHCHFKEPLNSNFSTLVVNPCFRLRQTVKLCLFLGQLIALSSYILMLSLSHSFCVFFIFFLCFLPRQSCDWTRTCDMLPTANCSICIFCCIPPGWPHLMTTYLRWPRHTLHSARTANWVAAIWTNEALGSATCLHACLSALSPAACRGPSFLSGFTVAFAICVGINNAFV